VKPAGTVTSGRGLTALAAWAVRVSQYERAAEAPVPVSQYRVMLSTIRSVVRCPRLTLDEGARDLLIAVGVVVEHPGGERDG
jgi:hypothetical protein